MTDASFAGPVLVTGATGFVGQHLLRAVVARGISARALVHRSECVDRAPGVTLALGDITDADALARAVAGIRVVIHLAGRAHILREHAPDPLAEFRRVNVEGTRALLSAARTAGVERFVYVSSSGAVADVAASRIGDATPPMPNTAYGRSKREAELVVAAFDSPRMRTVTIRPPMVYGPGQRGNPHRLFRLVARGVPLPVGLIRNRRSLMYVDNLAAALLVAAAAPNLDARPYFVTDPDVLSTPQLVRVIAAALGVRARLVDVPPRLGNAAVGALSLMSRLLHRPLPLDAWTKVASSLEVDGGRFASEAPFTSSISLDRGMTATAASYRDRA